MKKSPALRLFIAVLILDFSYDLFNYIRFFDNREDKFSSILFSLLFLVPLVALILLCTRLPKIEDKRKLSVIKKCLIVYLAVSLYLGIISSATHVPFYIGFLFYSNNWCFFINQIFNYEQYELTVSLGIIILYWVAYGFLLSEISKRIKATEVLEDTANSAEPKLAPSYKISIVNRIILVIQTLFDFAIFLGIQGQKGTSGEHALGAAFVVLLLIFIKLIISIPVLILSIVGIIKAHRDKDKNYEKNDKAKTINIACLVISQLQVWLWN